jgi:glutaredoxin
MVILAVLLAPIIAIQVSTYLEKRRERRLRRFTVFRTLMTARATTLSPVFVEALNMIDVEFYGKDRKPKAVSKAWKSLLDHLYDKTLSGEAWTIKKEDLTSELLHKMALSLGYHFDKVHIKRATYFPSDHGEIKEDHKLIRKGLRALFAGERSLPMEVTSFPTSDEIVRKLDEMQKLLKHFLSGEKPLKVTIFGTDACPYTTSAREEYIQKGYEVEYVDIKSNPEELPKMLDHSNGRNEQPVIVDGGEVTIGFGGT